MAEALAGVVRRDGGHAGGGGVAVAMGGAGRKGRATVSRLLENRENVVLQLLNKIRKLSPRQLCMFPSH